MSITDRKKGAEMHQHDHRIHLSTIFSFQIGRERSGNQYDQNFLFFRYVTFFFLQKRVLFKCDAILIIMLVVVDALQMVMFLSGENCTDIQLIRQLYSSQDDARCNKITMLHPTILSSTNMCCNVCSSTILWLVRELMAFDFAAETFVTEGHFCGHRVVRLFD